VKWREIDETLSRSTTTRKPSPHKFTTPNIGIRIRFSALIKISFGGGEAFQKPLESAGEMEAGYAQRY
jgi:hypothetical protein